MPFLLGLYQSKSRAYTPHKQDEYQYLVPNLRAVVTLKTSKVNDDVSFTN